MVLALEITSGPFLGQKFQIHEGFRVGRREGHLRLEHDVKVSGLHAEIELDNKGQLVLVDRQSANALVLNQRRVKRVALLPGVRFRIGETDFQVTEVSAREAEAIAPAKSWRERLQESFALTHDRRTVVRSLETFTPALILEFIQGIQAETEYVVTYGPRVAGLGHLDLELREPDCPERAFELNAGPGAIYLKDLTGGRVRLNREPFTEPMPLHEGDIISIGSSRIRVRFL